LDILDRSLDIYTLKWYRHLAFKGTGNSKRRDRAKNL
jgi:hypothetical protein